MCSFRRFPFRKNVRQERQSRPWQARHKSNQTAGTFAMQRAILPTLLLWLEPLESAWEFYINRDEIMEELIGRAFQFARGNSIKASISLAACYAFADTVARLGCIGKRGEGLFHTIQHAPAFQDMVEEHLFGRLVTKSTDAAIDLLEKYRKLGKRSKCAVAFSAGALFSKTAINATVAMVRLTLTTFVVVEGLSFAGVIGEPGESIVDWFETNEAKTNAWIAQIRQYRKQARKHINFENVENWYETAVEKEKVASLGFAVGSLVGMF